MKFFKHLSYTKIFYTRCKFSVRKSSPPPSPNCSLIRGLKSLPPKMPQRLSFFLLRTFRVQEITLYPFCAKVSPHKSRKDSLCRLSRQAYQITTLRKFISFLLYNLEVFIFFAIIFFVIGFNIDRIYIMYIRLFSCVY